MSDRPEYIDPSWCNECGEEKRFVGIQANHVRFFCDNCTYRTDYRVSNEIQQRYTEEKEQQREMSREELAK